MRLALVTFSEEGALIADIIRTHSQSADIYLHDSVKGHPDVTRFSKVLDLTRGIFSRYRGLVYIAPCGVVVRAIAPCIEHKLTDPAIVVVDAGGRFAVSLIGGHEGGANDLAMYVANIIGAEPVISTTTEALKDIIVGVGCRRGVPAQKIRSAIESALHQAGLEIDRVRLLASVDVKADEAGLLLAAQQLGLPLRFVTSDEVRASTREFKHSDFVEDKVNLPAVAEPAALLAGRRTTLVLPRTKHDGVTVAIAKESFPWSESDPEAR